MSLIRKVIFLNLISILSANLNAQPLQIAVPDVNYNFSDTVFISPNGNDSNTGKQSQPMASFAKAIQKLPFGITGKDDGHAWGLVVLLDGRYTLTDGLLQSESEWKKGNTYKNISLQGWGDVTIGGTAAKPLNTHGIRLCGKKVFIDNIKIKYASLHGVLINGFDNYRPNNIIITNVVTDSVSGFGMLIGTADTVLVSNSRVLRGAQFGNQDLKSPCQWPSGLKFLECTQVSSIENEVGLTRGEGLNFHNSMNCRAFKNRLHDNTVNLYIDNSKNLLIESNYFYNTEEGRATAWKGCPADSGESLVPGGILMANEGACPAGSIVGPVFENCTTKCSIPPALFPNVDSVFIYNNLFNKVSTVLNVWEGVVSIHGVNCISNVYFHHNTAIGCEGTANQKFQVVNFFLPSYNAFTNSYSRISNFNIENNIFSFDKVKYPKGKEMGLNFNALVGSPDQVKLKGNLWNTNHSDKGATDKVNTALPVTLPAEVYEFQKIAPAIRPCPKNPSLICESLTTTRYPPKDFSGLQRNETSNVGALIYLDDCNLLSVEDNNAFFSPVFFYPNPTNSILNYRSVNEHVTVKCFDILGVQVFVETLLKEGRLDLSSLDPGIYFIKAEFEKRIFTSRIIRQ